MCGIVGGVSTQEIAPFLIEGLRRLEYRGYDSAGLAIVDSDRQLSRLRSVGKVHALALLERQNPLHGLTGIAHTRWATHGVPCEINAHPHVSCEEIAVVHNGIIENHDQLRQRLVEAGYIFSSQTDSEVCAHLIHLFFGRTQNLLQATQAAMAELEGAFAIGVVHQHYPDELIAARKGSPLVVGSGATGSFIASDALALQGMVDELIYLEDGDIATLTRESIEVYDSTGNRQQRTREKHDFIEQRVDKGNYRHFMLKEIHEQPQAIAATLQGRLTENGAFPEVFGQQAGDIFPRVKQIHIVACGTSYHAGLVAKYWIESLCGLPCAVEVASEYQYREVVVPADTLFVTVSQSGETADTLAALRKAKKKNYVATLGICNVASSTLVRETDLVFLTRAGTEIGVASTKAFTTQLCGFMLLTLALGLRPPYQPSTLAKTLLQLPQLCEQLLELNDAIQEMATQFIEKQHALFLGRGVQFPVALEGALKLKEISYIHAEAYPAGELKHGPLALVDAEMPVVAVAPNDQLLEKLRSNLEEVKARGGKLFLFADEALKMNNEEGIHMISVPTVSPIFAPIAYTIPLQLLAYHVAVLKGTDVDQPRNLAKSVTVE